MRTTADSPIGLHFLFPASSPKVRRRHWFAGRPAGVTAFLL